MSQETWSAVDEYVSGLLAPHDEALAAALRASEEAGLPEIQVSPPQGKLLQLLAQAIGASSILEFGTLGGYSTIWLARALPEGGRLITLEAEARNAAVASPRWRKGSHHPPTCQSSMATPPPSGRGCVCTPTRRWVIACGKLPIACAQSLANAIALVSPQTSTARLWRRWLPPRRTLRLTTCSGPDSRQSKGRTMAKNYKSPAAKKMAEAMGQSGQPGRKR